jgi:hypothetical protein
MTLRQDIEARLTELGISSNKAIAEFIKNNFGSLRTAEGKQSGEKWLENQREAKRIINGVIDHVAEIMNDAKKEDDEEIKDIENEVNEVNIVSVVEPTTIKDFNFYLTQIQTVMVYRGIQVRLTDLFMLNKGVQIYIPDLFFLSETVNSTIAWRTAIRKIDEHMDGVGLATIRTELNYYPDSLLLSLFIESWLDRDVNHEVLRRGLAERVLA